MMKILAIGDNRDNLTTLKAVLKDALPGCALRTAVNGPQGIELARAEDPDVILLDIVMPGMDGFEVCRRLKADELLRSTPVVFLTPPRTDHESRVKALEAGAEAFLSKPLDEQELIAQIRAMAKIKAANQLRRLEKEQLAELVAERTRELEQELAERRQAEEALRQSGEELATILDILPAIVWIGLDPECRVITGNRAANELTGTAAGTNVSQTAAAAGQATYLKQLKEDGSEYQVDELPMQRAIVLGKPVQDAEIRFCFSDGRQVDAFGHAAPLFDAQGQVRGAVAAFTDITERKQAEEALRQSEKKFALAFRTFPYALTIMRMSDGMFIETNDNFSSLTGFAREEAVGHSSHGLKLWVHEEDRQCVIAALMEGRSVTDRECQFRKKNGEIVTGLFSTLVIRLGNEPCILASINDITERKRVEEAVRESLERFQLANRATYDAIWDWSIQTDALAWNENFQMLFGYQAEEIKPGIESWISHIHPDDHDRVKTGIHAAIDSGQDHWSAQYRLRRKDGTYAEVEDRGYIAREASGDAVRMIGAIRDITARKRLEEERTRLEARLRQQQKLEAIGTLAGGVAHEINNPINGIMNYAQLIADTAAPGHPAAGYAAEILAETARVATIVRNLLQFSRQDTQSHSPARIQDIVEQTLSLLRTVFRRDQITLTVDVPEDLPSLKCRSQQIQQVLMNLLTNARDALNAKYPGYHEAKTLAVRVAPFEQAGRRWLRLTVADQGNGIPPEIQARIFDPFFSTKPRDKGTGLGLSISHGIVEEHNGVLHFETTPGRGTQFHLDLPVDNGWAVEGE